MGLRVSPRTALGDGPSSLAQCHSAAYLCSNCTCIARCLSRYKAVGVSQPLLGCRRQL